MFQMKDAYGWASSDIVHEDFDGECVILNLTLGTYYALSKTASKIVTCVLEGTRVEELATLSGEAFEPADVQAFLSELVRLDLIAPTPEASPQPVPASLRTEAQTWADQPTVEVFDDLADLILADPIHDTEASVGWPTIPAAEQASQKRAG